MSTKFISSDSRKKLITKEISLNLKSLQGLGNILYTNNEPKKYIVTLRPLSKGANLPDQISPKAEDKEVIISEEDVLKGKSMFAIKTGPRSMVLETIEERSESSRTSLEIENYDLKLKQATTDLLRLKGGCGLQGHKKEKSHDEQVSNSTNENEKVNTDEVHNESFVIVPEDNENKTKEVKETKETKKAEETEVTKTLDSLNGRNQTNQSEDLALEINELTAQAGNEAQQSKDHSLDDNEATVQTSSTLGQTPTPVSEAFSSKDNDKTVPASESQSKPVASTDVITSSFIENLVEETVPVTTKETLSIPSPNCQIEQSIPIYRESRSCHTQCNLAAEDLVDLFCILPPDQEICKRIENLEEQMKQIYIELKDLQKELLPTDDLAKFNVLSKHFYEVENLLQELKVNCSKLHNTGIEMNLEGQANNNEYMELTSQEKLPSLSDFSFEETNTLASQNIDFETCNCELSGQVFVESKGNQHSPVQNNACRCLVAATKDSDNSTIAEEDTSPLSPCGCIKHLKNLQKQNQNEQSRQQNQQKMAFVMANSSFPNNSHRRLPDTTSKFHEPKEAEVTFMAGKNKFVSGHGNNSPTNLAPLPPVKQSKIQINEKLKLSHFLPYQPAFRTAIPSLKSAPRKNNMKKASNNLLESTYKKFPAHLSQYNNKLRKFSDNETSISNNRLSFTEQTSSDDSITTDFSVQEMTSSCMEELPVITHNLSKAIWTIIGNRDSKNVALTVFLESNNLYHINVSAIKTGQCLGCICTDEKTFEQAKKDRLFDNFLLFLVLSPDNSRIERNKVFDLSFEFINTRD